MRQLDTKHLTTAVASLLAMLFAPWLALGQTGSIDGTVTEENSNKTLPGASVRVVGTDFGTATGPDGTYEIESVPAGSQTLRVTFVGYETRERTVEVPEGGTVTADFQLPLKAEELGEVVVTGVSVGRSTKKTGFAISKIDEDQLEKVPSTDPANALRGKVAGAQVTSASGLPGSSPEIRLRGTSVLSGDQSPLIVVDGAITQGNLEDIDMQSVKSIEVIKGAAAAALYGSLAANGVVQVITKRGAEDVGTTRITVRNEVGISRLANKVDLATHHNRARVTEDGEVIEEFRPDPGEVSTCSSAPCDPNPVPNQTDAVYDNDYKGETFDQQEAIFTPKPFFTNYVSAASRTEDGNYFLSFENLSNGGVVEELPSYKRRNVRLNIDNQVTDNFRVTASTLYSNSSGPNTPEQGQGGNAFYGALLAQPDFDIAAPAPDSLDARYNPYSNSGNATNPLYQLSVNRDEDDAERVLGNFNASYEFADWLTVDGQFSYDQRNSSFNTFTPVGTLPSNPSGSPSEGYIYEESTASRVAIAQGKAVFAKEFGDFGTEFTGSYLYEDRKYKFDFTEGNEFLVGGVPRFDNVPNDRLDSGSQERNVKAEDLVGTLVLDYDDTYTLDTVLRRDGLSLFGPEVRYQTYWRLAGSYRVTEDFNIPGVNELKLRSSYGTGGQRPDFAAQYETYNVSPTGISKDVLGNTEIEPANVTELEAGLDVQFLDRYYFNGTYATKTADEQVLLVPLSAVAGYSDQYQNAGTIESDTYEFTLGGTPLRRNDTQLHFNVTFSSTDQKLTELSRSSYKKPLDGSAANPFRLSPGTSLGAMYGSELATSIGQLTFDDSGCLVGYSPATGGDACLEQGDLTTNDDGYVIEEGTQYTRDETPFIIKDETGANETRKIGNAIPDFSVGLSSTFDWKHFSLYALLDWQQGGDVYNYTKQLLIFNDRAGVLDQSDKPEGQRRPETYYDVIYNAATPTSYFAEDASFLKVREISLSYNFTNDVLGRVGLDGVLYDAELSLIGRNLFTFTGYDGYDPEVGVGGGDNQATTYRLDEFAYPNFRTYTASLKLRF